MIIQWSVEYLLDMIVYPLRKSNIQLKYLSDHMVIIALLLVWDNPMLTVWNHLMCRFIAPSHQMQ
jgi:hypothetical protein